MSYEITNENLQPDEGSNFSPFPPVVLSGQNWLHYDADEPLTKRASRPRRYTTDAVTPPTYRTTQDHAIRREPPPREKRPPEEPLRREKRPPEGPLHEQNFMRRHSLSFIGLGMLLALLLVFLVQFGGSWITNTVDNIRYGNPRTYQIDAFVGHETGKTASHFIAINLHGQIEVIEFPGGDSTKAKIYLGPQLYDTNAEKVPVSLQFIDVKHDHHPDMYVQIGSTQLIFHNTGTGFQTT